MSVSQVIAALSADVVAGLAALTPAITLYESAIVLGRHRLRENVAGPRIVAIPIGSAFSESDVASISVISDATERRAEASAVPIQSDVMTFEMHVQGIASPPDPNAGDFDTTQAMVDQVIRSADAIMRGVFKAGAGRWTSGMANAQVVMNAGQEFVFTLSIGRPITQTPLPYAPTNTSVTATTSMTTPDNPTPELSCTG